MSAFQRTRDDDCLSDLALDRLRLGERTSDALQAHLTGCAACRARLGELQLERAAFAGSGLRLTAPARPRSRRWMRWLPVAATAMAAAVALFVLRTAPEPGTRTKGGARLSFYVKRGDRIWRGAEGEKVAPGDALRFTFLARERRFVAVLSLDGAKQASLYYPPAGSAVAIARDVEVALPLAVQLDGTLGHEQLFGLACVAPIALEPLRAELQRSGRLEAPAGCELDTLGVDKEAAR